MANLILAAIAFVGTHFLMSHPLRAPIVAATGEKGFLGVYSLVSLATFAWMVWAYLAAPAEPVRAAGDVTWALVTIVMLVASVLLVGSLVGNPALPGAGGGAVPEPRGVFAVTRHPMMWSFALWGACHIAIWPATANVVLCAAIIVLALVGARFQDTKKAMAQPDFWPKWEARTSYWPFAAIAAGRASLGGFRAHSLLGGLVVWLAATWAHIPIAGWAAGVWRWIV